MIKVPTIDADDGQGGVFPHSACEFEIEVRDVLGHWCRLRGSYATAGLVKDHLETIYGEKIPWDEIRVIVVDKTEYLLDINHIKPRKKK